MTAGWWRVGALILAVGAGDGVLALCAFHSEIETKCAAEVDRKQGSFQIGAAALVYR